MCGIVGYIGKTNYDVRDIQILMLSNIIRGIDASGFWTKNSGIVKDCVPADLFLATNRIPESNIFIGHCRKSTYGNDKRAHPFEMNNIIGVHNGTLTNHYDMKADKFHFLESTNFHIDSEILIGALNAENYQVLSIYDGAAALIWYDRKNPDHLYFYHDNKRPLFRGNKKDGLFLSSTEESLVIIDCINIKEVKPDIVYQADLNGILPQYCKKINNNPYKKIYSSNQSRVNTPMKYFDNAPKDNTLSSKLLSIFNPERFLRQEKRYPLVDLENSLFTKLCDEPYDPFQNIVIKLHKLEDSDIWVCFDLYQQGLIFELDYALSEIKMDIGTICELIDSNYCHKSPISTGVSTEFAVIKSIVENTQGIYYTCEVYEFDDSNKMIASYEDDFLPIQLLPLPEEFLTQEIFETSTGESINDLEVLFEHSKKLMIEEDKKSLQVCSF